jgi:hypothetical protein
MAQHRLDGLFYNCPEKFSREHIKQCTMKGIYFLEIADREESGDEQQDDDMTISICALTGSHSSSTLQLATVVHGVPLEALVDSGSTHSFVDATTPDRLGLHIEELPGLIVGVANGDRVPALGVCRDISIRIDAEDFTVDLYVIRLGGYELVLGCVNGFVRWGPSCGISAASPWRSGTTTTRCIGAASQHASNRVSPPPSLGTRWRCSWRSSQTSSSRPPASLHREHATIASTYCLTPNRWPCAVPVPTAPQGRDRDAVPGNVEAGHYPAQHSGVLLSGPACPQAR